MVSKVIAAFFVSFLFESTCFAAADISPLIGTWERANFDCPAVEGGSDSYQNISEGLIKGHEVDCKIRHVKRKKDSYKIKLLCTSEGETYKNKARITLIGKDKIKINSTTYKRCVFPE